VTKRRRRGGEEERKGRNRGRKEESIGREARTFEVGEKRGVNLGISNNNRARGGGFRGR